MGLRLNNHTHTEHTQNTLWGPPEFHWSESDVLLWRRHPPPCVCCWFLRQSLMLAEELVLDPINRPHLHYTGTEGRTGLDADVAPWPQ